MSSTIPTIQQAFQNLAPFLVGEPRQFLVSQGDYYCVRANPMDPEGKNPGEHNPCDGCPHYGQGCEIADARKIQVPIELQDGTLSGIEPHSRRGVGFEPRPFLVLQFKPGHSHATLPRTLWDNPHADKAMYEENLHFVLTDQRTATFHTFKGQLRYYGTDAEFAASDYAAYLDVVDHYDPVHRPVSLDFSAIEPRVSTVVSREPQWVSTFKGTPKIISKEVQFAEPPTKLPDYVYAHSDGRMFCYLNDELDKGDYGRQCGACALGNTCRTQQEHFKSVAGDWHGINATGLYGPDFTHAKDSFVKKELRGIAKIVGLALCYGGSAWTVSGNMNSTVEEAEARIAAFFSVLTTLSAYMNQAKSLVRQTGEVRNLFGRRWDVSKKSHSQAVDMEGKPDYRQRKRDVAEAERLSLNFPIQSTASELLKIAMIRVDQLITSRGWNPLNGLAMPQQIELRDQWYNELRFALISSIHDELLNLIRDDAFASVIPEVYTTMQLPDIMQGLQAGFTLELDCEFDETRSWTASRKFHTSRIYLLNRLAASAAAAETAGAVKREPNLALLDWAHCDPALVAATQAFTPDPTEECSFYLAVRDPQNTIYLHDRKFPRRFFEAVCAEHWRFAILE